MSHVVRRVWVYFQSYPGVAVSSDRGIPGIPWTRYVHGRRVATGTLDADGGVEVPVPVGCDGVELELFGTRYTILLTPGLPEDPLIESAKEARLRELGYLQHPRVGSPRIDGPGSLLPFARAVLGFQSDEHATLSHASGVADEATARRLAVVVPR